MKTMTAAVVLAALPVLGILTSVPGQAAVRTATNPVPIQKVDLHGAFAQALPHAKHGPIAYKVRPLGKRGSLKPARNAAASCTEPNCNLVYNNGSVQHTPHVYLLLWGPSWSSTGSDTQYLASFYSGLGVGPQDTWSGITSQYADGTGHPAFGSSVFAGAFQDTSTPTGSGSGGSIDQTDLTAEADAFTTTEKISDLGDAQIVIASQSGICFDDGWAGQPAACTDQPTPTYCAWHTSSAKGETFTNLPYTLDAGATCGQNFINSGTAGTYDGYSIIGGHEYAESITDPFPNTGWIDTADTVYGGEIGDKCVWKGQLWGGNDPAGDVTLSTGSFAMQSLWSNAAGGCVMSAPTTTSGPITGIGSKCLDDYHSSTSNGNTVDLYACNGTKAQLWTAGSGNTLTVLGKCLDDYHSSKTNGNKIDIWACNGTGAQQWVHQSNGSYQNPASGKCLDDYHSNTNNGNTIDLWTCNGTAAQKWTGP